MKFKSRLSRLLAMAMAAMPACPSSFAPDFWPAKAKAPSRHDPHQGKKEIARRLKKLQPK